MENIEHIKNLKHNVIPNNNNLLIFCFEKLVLNNDNNTTSPKVC